MEGGAAAAAAQLGLAERGAAAVAEGGAAAAAAQLGLAAVLGLVAMASPQLGLAVAVAVSTQLGFEAATMLAMTGTDARLRRILEENGTGRVSIFAELY